MLHSALTLDPEALDALSCLIDELAGRYELARKILLRKRDMLIARQPEALKSGSLQATDRELLAISQHVAHLDQERQRLQSRMGCSGWTLEAMIRALGSGAAPESSVQTAAQTLSSTGKCAR